MNYRKLDIIHHTGRTISALFIVLLLVAFLFTLRIPDSITEPPKNPNTPATQTATPRQKSTPPQLEPLNAEIHETDKFQKYFISGIISYNNEKYRQAEESFQKAAALEPGSMRPRYYLMLCYLKNEEDPYRTDSRAYWTAQEVKKLAPPDSPQAQKAEDIMRKAEILTGTQQVEKKTGSILSPPVQRQIPPKPLAKPAPVRKRSAPPVVRYPDLPDYPLSESNPRQKKTASIPQKTEKGEKAAVPDGKPIRESVSTLTGNISRPDENGNVFHPAGAEIHLMTTSGPGIYKAVSDYSGNFSIPGIEPGKDYFLVAISRYTSYRPINEFYYLHPAPPYPPCPKTTKPRQTPHPKPGGEYRKKHHAPGNPMYGNHPIPIGPSHPCPHGVIPPMHYGMYRTYSGGSVGFYDRYYDTGYHPGRYYESTRWVEKEDHMSWHFRIPITEPGEYTINLNRSNADSKFNPDIRPNINPVTFQPFPEIKDVFPLPVSRESHIR